MNRGRGLCHALRLIILFLFAVLSAKAATLTERISVATSGEQSAAGGIQICNSSGACSMNYFRNLWPSVSHDGRFVVFYSLAHNLVSSDTNNKNDVFLRDRATGSTIMISWKNGLPGNGNSTHPYISPSGQFISFRSEASNLVAMDGNANADIFLYEIATQQIDLISMASNATQANGHCFNSAVTPDGRYVVFDCMASNLVNQDNNGRSDIFIRDRFLSITQRLSVNAAGMEGNDASFHPAISADGRYIAFDSRADNIVAGDHNKASDVFVHDRETHSTTRVSVDRMGNEGNADSFLPSISADGRKISFRSLASNLVANDTNNAYDIFVVDMDSRLLQRVNVGNQGEQANDSSFFSSMSADGTRVSFDSRANNLVSADGNASTDIFVRDLSALETVRVSVASDASEANQSSSQAVISGDGRYVVFESFASNLIAGDSNGNKDIFIRDTGARNRPPIANAGADATLECLGTLTSVTLDGSQSSDPDGDSLTYLWSGGFGSTSGVTTQVDLALGTQQIDLSVSDSHGAIGTDSVQLTVVDTTPPVIDMPYVVTLEASSAAGSTYSLFPVYHDKCSPVTVSIAPELSVFPIGSTKIVIQANDTANNVSVHHLTVEVEDTIPPSITPPANMTIEATAELTPVALPSPPVSDAVGVVSVTHDGPNAFPIGLTTVTWTAWDAAGNSQTATQTVTVSDNTPPKLSVPPDLFVEASGPRTWVDIGHASVEDIFAVSVSNNAPENGFTLGTTQVVWEAVDSNANKVQAEQRITVRDTTPPELAIPGDIIAEATGIHTVVDVGLAVAVDKVDGEVLVSHDAPLFGFPLGPSVVTWTASDSHGNTATALQSVNVFDTTPPVLVIPEDVSRIAEGPMSSVNLGEAQVSDLFSVSVTNDAPELFPIGKTEVLWTALDANGNSVSAVQTVHLRYGFNGFLPPLRENGHYHKRFLPVRLKLAYSQGQSVKNAHIDLVLRNLSKPGTSFRYNDVFRRDGKVYAYRLNTRTLPKGDYRLEVYFDDDTGAHGIHIQLRHRHGHDDNESEKKREHGWKQKIRDPKPAMHKKQQHVKRKHSSHHAHGD